MSSDDTIYGRLRARALQQPDRPAILASGKRTVKFDELLTFIERSRTRLHEFGIGRRTRMGILLPERVHTGIAYLVGASTCVSAPLNPAAPPDELRGMISDMGIDAMLISPDCQPSQRDVVHTTVQTVITAHPEDVGSLLFRLESDSRGGASNPALPEPDDIALLLQTSGTTGRPKIVPQSHHNRVVNADRTCETMELTPEDVCMQMMPTHHTQGLLGEFLSPLLAGASVVFVDIDPARLVDNVMQFQPTWFNIVPSLHEAVLARHRGKKAIFKNTCLRFASSSSARLGPDLRASLVELYGVTVRESYGATECGIVGLSAKLGTEYRYGSIGRPIHEDVIIADADGNPLPAGSRGEICVGGPTVISGYENNPEADAEAFMNGWYRMRDEGYFDADGFLFVTGRIHEVVNRGGEKFAIQEIDDALLNLEGVDSGAAFVVPHPVLGHEVYAAVVFEPGSAVTPGSLRASLAQKFSWAKVPKRVFKVDSLPMNSTGKVLKQQLASQLAHRVDRA